MLNPVEEAIQEHVILLLVGELGFTRGLKGAHEFTKLLLVYFAVPVRVPLQVLD
jgi:hypothetical protein